MIMDLNLGILINQKGAWWDRMSQAGNFTKKDIINILSQEFPTQQEIDDSIVYYKKY